MHLFLSSTLDADEYNVLSTISLLLTFSAKVMIIKFDPELKDNENFQFLPLNSELIEEKKPFSFRHR